MVLAAAQERLNPFEGNPLKTEESQEEETGPEAKFRVFVQEHRTALQVTGLAALAAATGAVGGLVMAQAGLLGNGTALLGGAGAGKFLAGGAVGLVGGGAIGWRVGHQRAVGRHKQQLRLSDALPERVPAQPKPDAGLPSTASASEATINELTQIRGIGPVYAGRLAQAGIDSLAELAARSPDELRTVVQSPGADSPGWITQAQALLEPAPAVRAEMPSDVRAALRLDRLEAIPGLTPRHAYRLNAAGILTYADLAAQTPESLVKIVQGNGAEETGAEETGTEETKEVGIKIPVDRWIIEAAKAAQS